MATRLSLVQDTGAYPSGCGYCGSRSAHENTSWAHGMMAEVLTPEAYQDLIDRGWRRSGRWMYQPLNDRTCCQLLTIRLDVLKFRPNKEQRRAARKWEEFLAGAPMGPSAQPVQPPEPQPQPQLQQQQQQQQGAQQQEERQFQPQQPQQRQGVQQQQPQQEEEGPHQRMAHHPDGVEFPADAEMREGAGACSAAAAVEAAVAAAAGPSAAAGQEAVRGASPKRLHEDLEGGGEEGGSGGSGGAAAAQHDWGEGLHGIKRLRSGGPSAASGGLQHGSGEGEQWGQWGQERGDEGAGGLEGASPTAQLASRMQHVLSPRHAQQQAQQPAFPPSPPSTAQEQQHDQQQGQHPGQQQHGCEPGAPAADMAALASCLLAALERCVEQGLLPAGAGYPQPRVQPPSARQRKRLPADVAATSAFALAVAGAARRALGGAGRAAANGSSCEGASAEEREAPVASAAPLEPAEVAGLLAARADLPQGITVTEEAGHLNFHVGSGGSGGSGGSRTEGPAALAGPAAPAAPQQQQQKARKQLQQQRQQQREVERLANASSPAAAGAAAVAAASAEVAAAGPAAAAGAAVPRGVQRHFELRMVSSDASLIAVEFELYRKYQVVHHGDHPNDVTPTSFKRFLCDSPLRFSPPAEYPPGGAPPCGYGSFHQQYWLDGRLVAVGVVDVLPSCLSSVYLFWDPDLGPLSLGKVSALKEIEWVAGAARSCPRLHYYYLGFYIQDCHRMRYKGDYAPSDLLCPVSKCWVPLDRCRQALEQPGMVPLSQLPGALEGLGPEHLVGAGGVPMAPPVLPTDEQVDQVRLFVQSGGLGRGQMVTFRQLVAVGALPPAAARKLRLQLAEWVRAVGPCWPTLLYRL